MKDIDRTVEILILSIPC